jgi:hypothetical protein
MIKIMAVLGFLLILGLFVYDMSMAPPGSNKSYKEVLVKTEIYQVGVIIIVTQDTLAAFNRIRKYLNDTTIKISDFDVQAITFDYLNEGYSPVVWTHELFHVTTTIMNYAGIPLTNSSEEAYAYLLGHLEKEFYERCKRSRML